MGLRRLFHCFSSTPRYDYGSPDEAYRNRLTRRTSDYVTYQRPYPEIYNPRTQSNQVSSTVNAWRSASSSDWDSKEPYRSQELYQTSDEVIYELSTPESYEDQIRAYRAYEISKTRQSRQSATQHSERPLNPYTVQSSSDTRRSTSTNSSPPASISPQATTNARRPAPPQTELALRPKPTQPSTTTTTNHKAKPHSSRPPAPTRNSPASPTQSYTSSARHPAQTLPTGDCPKCHHGNAILRTKPKPNSINVGRPFRSCPNKPACGRFNGFADDRGLTMGGRPNALCRCARAMPMRLVAESEVDGRGWRAAFYSCERKACGAWEWCVDGRGERAVFSGQEIEGMVGRGEI